MSRVTQILIAESVTSVMTPRTDARAVPGRGLEGDRYFFGKGTFSPTTPKLDYEITFIEQENIDQFARESGLPFTALHARRNIVTEGVRLNDLVGKEFLVGEVRIRGWRFCEPCTHLATASFPETLRDWCIKGVCEPRSLLRG